MKNVNRRLAVTLIASALTGALIWASLPSDARGIHGGIATGGGPPPSGQIASFPLANTGGSSETPMWSKMFAHFFDDNDVTGCPLSGGLPTYPIFKVGSTTLQYTMSTPRYYPSGRICHAMFSLLLANNITLASSATTTITVNQGASTIPVASSRSLSDLTAADIKSIVTFLDNGSGTYTATLNDGISSAYSDNITWADGAAGKVVRVRATYKTSGTPEGNLENYFYVFIRQDASGNYGGCEVMSRMATPWGNATAAKRQWKSFSAMTFQTGSTVIRDNVASGRSNTGTFTWAGSGDAISVNTPSAAYESWTAVRFTTTGTLPPPLALNTTYYIYTGSYYTPPYTKFSVYTAPGDSSSNYVVMTGAGSGVHTYTIYPWITCYGSLFLCGTTGEYDYIQGGGSVAPVSGYVMTNIQVKTDMSYAMKAYGIPAYDLTAPVTAGGATPFYINTNCGLTNTPDAGGIDEHIGILPTPMVRYIYTQSLTDERNVRAIGLAGGQIGSCLRLSTTGRIPPWNNGHGGSGTPYSGMGSTLYWNSRYSGSPGSSTAFQAFDNQSYGNLTGQQYGDASHRTAYNWFPYAIFGQLEYLDMLIETANCAPASGYNGGSGPAVSRISTSAYGPHGTATADGSAEGSRNVTAPDGITRFGLYTLTESKRQDSWQHRDVGICAGLIPNSFTEWQYFQDLSDDNIDFMTAVAANPPTAYAGTNGLFYPQGAVYIDPQWQTAYMIMALSMEYGLRKNAKSLALINKLNTWLAHIMNTYGLYAIDSEEWLTRTAGNGNASPLISNDNQLGFYNGGLITWANGSANFTFTNPDLVPSVGDGLFFSTPNPPSQQTTPVPAAFNTFQKYFVVSRTGTGPYTLQLSATAGGSAIVNTDAGAGGITVWIQPASPVNTLFANNVTDYPTVIYRSMLLSKSRGATVDATAQAAMAAACPTPSSFGSTPTYCFKASV